MILSCNPLKEPRERQYSNPPEKHQLEDESRAEAFRLVYKGLASWFLIRSRNTYLRVQQE